MEVALRNEFLSTFHWAGLNFTRILIYTDEYFGIGGAALCYNALEPLGVSFIWDMFVYIIFLLAQYITWIWLLI